GRPGQNLNAPSVALICAQPHAPITTRPGTRPGNSQKAFAQRASPRCFAKPTLVSRQDGNGAWSSQSRRFRCTRSEARGASSLRGHHHGKRVAPAGGTESARTAAERPLRRGRVVVPPGARKKPAAP